MSRVCAEGRASDGLLFCVMMPVFATAKQNPEKRDQFIDFIYRNQDFNSA